MVSTRSSARKPPNPSRPSSAPSRLASQTQPTPVHDDPPPTNPRRSRRIKLKNAENPSSQPVSPDSSLTTSLIETPQHQKQTHHPQRPSLQNDQHKETSSPAPSEHPIDAQHSDDEAPEEIKTETVDPHIDPAHEKALQNTIKKNRRRRHRNRNRRKKNNDPPIVHPIPSPSQYDLQLQQLDAVKEPLSPVTERLPEHVIADAKNVLEDAEKRGNDAEQIALLGNQVEHVVKPNVPLQIGRTKVALLSDTFPLTHRRARKGRKSAATFLASCIQKGPRRVPASRIAMMARSKTLSRS